MITFILNKAKWKIEEPYRNFPYSDEKAKRRATLLY